MAMNVEDGTLTEEGPATLVGQWLSGAALERIDQRNRAREGIARTGGFTTGRAEVVRQTFVVAVEHWFPSTRPIEDVHDVINRFIDYFGDFHRFAFIEVEALVRAARGEDVSIDRMGTKGGFIIRQSFFVFLCLDLEVSRRVINDMVREAERRTAEAGVELITPEEQAETGVSSADLCSPPAAG
jgi:hypothetical protein